MTALDDSISRHPAARSWIPKLREKAARIQVGDRVRFKPAYGPNWWWTVGARDDRYIVTVRQAEFLPKGECCYSVVDTQWGAHYNNVPPGVARSGLDRVFDPTDISLEDPRPGCEQVITWLTMPDPYGLSWRRIAKVWDIEVAS